MKQLELCLRQEIVHKHYFSIQIQIILLLINLALLWFPLNMRIFGYTRCRFHFTFENQRIAPAIVPPTKKLEFTFIGPVPKIFKKKTLNYTFVPLETLDANMLHRNLESKSLINEEFKLNQLENNIENFILHWKYNPLAIVITIYIVLIITVYL